MIAQPGAQGGVIDDEAHAATAERNRSRHLSAPEAAAAAAAVAAEARAAAEAAEAPAAAEAVGATASRRCRATRRPATCSESW